MQFRRSKLRYFSAITFGCASSIASIIFSQPGENTIEWIIIAGVCYLIAVLSIAFSSNKPYYRIIDRNICFSSPNGESIISIDEIDYLKSTFTRGNRKEYEIVFLSSDQNPINVNVNFLNEKGESLITVLKNEFNIKYNNF